MRRVIVLFFSLLVVLVSAVRADTDGAPACSGFPWTVTATQVGARVAVNFCGYTVGCEPHKPQSSVVGSDVRVTVTRAELPDCNCVQPSGNFSQTVFVTGVDPGDYTVRVFVVDCGVTTPAGSTNFTMGAVISVPTLDPRGFAALALLLAAVATWRLRP